MPLTTRKASDNVIVAPSFMFVGNAGTGKTTMLAQAAKFLVKERGGKFLVLAFEPKERTAVPEMVSCPPSVEICDSPRWSQIMEVFSSLYQEYTAGIGIDGFDGYCVESFYDVLGIANKPRFNVGQEFLGHQNAWHIQMHRMNNHFKNLLAKGIPIIATCRLDVEKNETGTVVLFRTCAQGAAGLHVPPLFTVLGLCKYKGGSKEEWTVSFRPEYGFPARDTGGRLAASEPANFANIWNKVITAPSPSVDTKDGVSSTKST